jgi:multidrug efflux pump subunit AcrB
MIHKIKTALRVLAASLLLSVVMASLAGCYRARLESPRHAIAVEARYPGTNAQVVSDTIAAPIEQQVKGVEKLLTLRSRSGDDGLCTITVTFADGVDLSAALGLVENCVKQALPGLPDLVQRGGVVVTKRSAGVGLILFLSSPDGRFDDLYLSNYANTQLKNELARAAGVAEVALVGSRDYCLRIWLDPARLAAYELTATDVVKALERQNSKPATAPVELRPDKSPELQTTVSGLGQLGTVGELEDLVILADAGRDIRLRDIARVELGAAGAGGRAQLDGKPGLAMAIRLMPHASPSDVNTDLRQLMTRLAASVPDGIALDIAFDFTANLENAERTTSPLCVLADMDAPTGASVQRKLATLDHADHVMRLGKEVKSVLSLTDNVFDGLPDRPCMLVCVAPAGKGRADIDTMIEAIRRQLEKQVADAAFRLRDLSRPKAFPRCGYSIDLAVCGPEGNRARSFARKLVERLRASNKLTDVWNEAEAVDRSRVQVDVDATAAKAQHVALCDVANTIQVFFGELDLELHRSGERWQTKLRSGGEVRDRAADIKHVMVRNTAGNMVPLSGLVTLRTMTGPGVEERLNGQPMIEITANPAPGISLGEIRTLCKKLAAAVHEELRLTADYRLTWLDDDSAAR